MQNAMAKPDNAGAAATDYMHLFGLVALGYMWAQIAKAALANSPIPRRAELMEAKLRPAPPSSSSACCRNRPCASPASPPAPTR